MAVCNLFKSITKDTGTFFTFSQYTEDLTKMATQNGLYKVTPSKFIALNIDYSKFNNETFPNVLQNDFENGCAYLREKDGSEWNPKISSNIFWNMMYEKGLISSTGTDVQKDTSIEYINEVKYVGEINLQSYDEHAGMGYSEIYCYIPNEAKRTYLGVNFNSSEIDDVIIYQNTYAVGYTEEEYNRLKNEGIDIEIPKGTEYVYNEDVKLEFDTKVPTNNNDALFNINTIIVLYDVVYSNGGLLDIQYSNIPMGLYITGKINDDGSVTNTVTKHVNNEDIYNTGTAYGLRICSRFTPSLDNNPNINITTDSSYAAICKVMSEFSKTQAKMNEVVESIYATHGMFKEELSMFKNYRANIPYIKSINGKNYWFVNGQNTNILAEGGVVQNPCDCTAEDKESVVDRFNTLDKNKEEVPKYFK